MLVRTPALVRATSHAWSHAMSDGRSIHTQELISAKHLANSPQSTDSCENDELDQTGQVCRAQPRSSGLEQAMRWISPLVFVMMLAAGIGLYFQKQKSIHSGLSQFRKRSSSPIEFALWLGGSEQTLEERFRNKLDEVQRQSDAEWEKMRANMEQPLEFDTSDLVLPWMTQED
jgi:hypothetical protein